jgi:hypothetical protein
MTTSKGDQALEALRNRLNELNEQKRSDRAAQAEFRQDWESKVKHGLDQIKDWLAPFKIYSDVFGVNPVQQHLDLTFRGQTQVIPLDGLNIQIGDHVVGFIPTLIVQAGEDPTAAKIVISGGPRQSMELQYHDGGWRLYTLDDVIPWSADSLERLLLASGRLTL